MRANTGYPRDCGAGSPRRLPEEARPQADPRAVRSAPCGRRPALRRAEARRAPSALRRPARNGRGAQELGGAQGPLAARGREAPGRPRRGPSRRVRRLRGHDSRRQLRRRRGHRVGPRLVSAGEGRRSARSAAQRTSRGRAVRRQAARALDAGAHGRQGQGMADAQEGGRFRRRGRGHRALSRVGAVRPHGGRGPPGRGAARGRARGARAQRRDGRRCGRGAPIGDAGVAGSAPVLRAGLALRDQVRRRPHPGRAGRRRGRALRAGRAGFHEPLPGSRRLRSAPCRRRASSSTAR